MKLDLQTIESAPAKAQPLLQGAKNTLGFVPNLYATFANSPAVLESYLNLSRSFAQTSFSPTEQQVVSISASVDNDCAYCVAAHTTIGQMQKVDADVLESLRQNQPLADAKLEALRLFTKSVVSHRGVVPAEEQEAFLAAGYTAAQALEVVLGVAMKALSNYSNHLAPTPLDAAFAPNAWGDGAAQKSEPELVAAGSCEIDGCGCGH